MSRDIALVLLGNAAVPAVSLIAAVILANDLGVNGRGEVASATVPVALAVSVLALGIPEAGTYYVARSGRLLSRPVMVWGALTLFAAGAAGSLLLFMTAGLFVADDAATMKLMQVATFGLVPSLLLGLMRGVAAGQHRWGLITAEQVIGVATYVGAVVVLSASSHLTTFSATLCLAFARLPAGIVYVPLLLRGCPHGPSSEDLNERPREFLAYGAKVWVGSIAGILLLRIDQVMIVPLADSRQLGLYVVAVSLSEVAILFNRAVRDVIFSREVVETDLVSLARATRISTLVTAMIGLCMAGVSAVALPLLFGSDFTPALPVTVLLLVATVIGNPGSISSLAFSARGRPGLRSSLLIVSMAVNVVVVILLVPKWGAVGAAVAAVASYGVAGILSLWLVRRLYGAPISEFLAIRATDMREIWDLTKGRLTRSRR